MSDDVKLAKALIDRVMDILSDLEKQRDEDSDKTVMAAKAYYLKLDIQFDLWKGAKK